MKPRITTVDQMLLAGLSFFGDPFANSRGWTEENEIGRLWNRFISFLERIDGVSAAQDPDTMYELHIQHGDTEQQGVYEVFVGLQVTALDALPVQLLVKVIPPTRFAQFTLSGEAIVSDWPYAIHTDWLPEAGLQADPAYIIERYDQRFKGMDQLAESELDILIPLL